MRWERTVSRKFTKTFRCQQVTLAHHSDYDFVASYDHKKRGGLLHIAFDHHISPGRKAMDLGPRSDFRKTPGGGIGN